MSTDPIWRSACLAIPSLAFQCELVERPRLLGSPVVLSEEAHARVADLTREARVRGVRVGMTLLDAVGLCPQLVVVEPRPALIAHYADALVDAMAIVSPLVEEAEQGLVFADLRGTEGLYPRFSDIQAAVFAAGEPRVRAARGRADAGASASPAARAEPLRAQPAPACRDGARRALGA